MAKHNKGSKRAPPESAARSRAAVPAYRREDANATVFVLAGLAAFVAVATYFAFFAPARATTGPADNELVAHILKHHDQVSQSEAQTKAVTHPRPVLAYLTPWNQGGYAVAERFASKFTHIAPVWFQIVRQGPENYQIRGEQDVRSAWLESMRKAAPHVKIVPRVIVEELTPESLGALLTEKIEQRAFVQEVSRVTQKFGLDGIVLELWSRIQMTPEVRPLMTTTVRNLGKRLHHKNLTLGLVVPPFVESFGPAELAALEADVDLFSMNTYDFSQPTTAGPNAPYDWVRKCVQDLRPTATAAPKLCVGLNFYGNIYGPQGGSAIVGHQYLDILRAQGPNIRTTWNSRAREHTMQFTTVQGPSSLYFPTTRSIAERVHLARDLGTGLALWEIGQGIDHFYQEL